MSAARNERAASAEDADGAAAAEAARKRQALLRRLQREHADKAQAGHRAVEEVEEAARRDAAEREKREEVQHAEAEAEAERQREAEAEAARRRAQGQQQQALHRQQQVGGILSGSGARPPISGSGAVSRPSEARADRLHCEDHKSEAAPRCSMSAQTYGTCPQKVLVSDTLAMFVAQHVRDRVTMMIHILCAAAGAGEAAVGGCSSRTRCQPPSGRAWRHHTVPSTVRSHWCSSCCAFKFDAVSQRQSRHRGRRRGAGAGSRSGVGGGGSSGGRLQKGHPTGRSSPQGRQVRDAQRAADCGDAGAGAPSNCVSSLSIFGTPL